MKLHKPLNDGLIPNHPDMSTKTFTQTILMDSKNRRNEASNGLCCISLMLGASNEKKSACTNNTRNIANMRNNSMFDCLASAVTCPFLFRNIFLLNLPTYLFASARSSLSQPIKYIDSPDVTIETIPTVKSLANRPSINK